MLAGALLGLFAGAFNTVQGVTEWGSTCTPPPPVSGVQFTCPPSPVIYLTAGIAGLVGAALGILAAHLAHHRWSRFDARAGTTEPVLGMIGGFILLMPAFVAFLGTVEGVTIGAPLLGVVLLLGGSMWLRTRLSAAPSGAGEEEDGPSDRNSGGWSYPRTPEEMAMVAGQPQTGYPPPEPDGGYHHTGR